MVKIPLLELRQISNRNILGLADPAFRQGNGLNELSEPLLWFSANSLHKNSGINIQKILSSSSIYSTCYVTQS